MAEVTEADHLYKTRYAKKLVELVGEQDKLQRMIPFSKGELVGDSFKQAVDLEYEHGYTMGGNDTGPTLRASISADGEQATVTPSQIIGRKKVGYRDLYRTNGAGEKAFTAMTVKKFKDLNLGHRRNKEISLLHGQSTKGLGVVGAAISGQVITINPSYWAPGLWMGSINQVIDVYQSDGSTLRRGDLVVSAVDEEAKTITVVGTGTGITTGDIIYRDTANASGTFKEAIGLRTALAVTSGSIFGITVTAHPLFKPSTYDFAGPISVGKLLKMAGKGHIKGLSGRAVGLISTRAFEVLNEQMVAARSFDSSYDSRKALNGVESIQLKYQGGTLDIVTHSMMFESEVCIFPFEEDMDPEDRATKRIGSVDLSNELPDADGRIFLHNTDAATKEIRSYSDEALFINALGRCVLGTGITYS